MFMMMMVQMMMTMMMKPMTGGSALPSNLRQVLADDGPICSYQHCPADPPHDCDEFIQSKVFTIFWGLKKIFFSRCVPFSTVRIFSTLWISGSFPQCVQWGCSLVGGSAILLEYKVIGQEILSSFTLLSEAKIVYFIHHCIFCINLDYKCVYWTGRSNQTCF